MRSRDDLAISVNYVGWGHGRSVSERAVAYVIDADEHDEIPHPGLG